MKLILALSITIHFFTGLLQQEKRSPPVHAPAGDSAMQYQISAFAVLQTKCNVCHRERNRNAVFTMANMNAWRININEQVFIRQRMPKGNSIVLSYTDKEALKKWISSLK